MSKARLGVPEVGATCVRTERCPGSDILTVTGELDGWRSRTLRRVVADAILVSQSQVILDLSAVTFIDAAGIGSLVYCRRVLATRCQDLVLVCSLESRVSRLLDITGLSPVMPRYHTREAALQALDSRSN